MIDADQNHSTRVAAGIANPIVFKHLTKGWYVDITLPAAEKFYKEISAMLQQDLIASKNIFYPFTDIADENNWSAKMGDDRFTNYIEHNHEKISDHVHAPFGYGRVKTFGNLKTGLFLDASKKYFQGKGIQFHSEKFDAKSAIENTDINFIFCEGIAVLQNPFFGYVPMKSSHGEVLTIHSENLNLSQIVSKNLFVLPLGDHTYKIGATYNWELTEPILTEAGKSDLIERLENLIDCDYQIIKHEAGVRPTVADRRPILGVHATHKNLFIFNGLGTKGVIHAPHFSKVLVNFLIDQTPLPDEVNITRFKKRFEKFFSL